MRFLFSVACVTVALHGVSDAYAQVARPERPYRGLFGGGVPDPEQLLTVEGATGTGYDTNVLFDQGGGQSVSSPRAAVASFYASFGGGLRYQLNKTKVQLGASESTSARYYSDVEDQFVAAHSGNVSLAWQPGRRTNLTLGQSISYQPFLRLFAAPPLFDSPLGQVSPPSLDIGVTSQPSTAYASDISVTQNLSKRASLSFSTSYTRNNYGGATGELAQSGDLTAATVGGRFSYAIGRGLSARAGYGFTDASYAGPFPDVRGHNLDVGVDFARSLSLSRRTTLTFGTGTSAYVYLDQTFYRFLGNARLVREIGRTWNAGIGYNRNVEFLAAFAQPVQSDNFNVGVGGLINHRLSFSAAATAFIGSVGFSGQANGYDTYTATTSITLSLTRHLGLNAGYSYYRYAFDENALPIRLVGLPSETNRHSVYASMAVWAPLLYRPRKHDVAR